MVNGLESKTVNWKFVESIEPPRVVRIVISSMINQENTYAQVTVRFHTKQVYITIYVLRPGWMALLLQGVIQANLGTAHLFERNL